MGEEFPQALCRIAVADLCRDMGFHAIKKSSADVLSDILAAFLINVGKTANSYCEQCGRTQSNFTDVERSLSEMGITVPELEDYYNTIVRADNISPFQTEIPHFPIEKKSVFHRNPAAPPLQPLPPPPIPKTTAPAAAAAAATQHGAASTSGSAQAESTTPARPNILAFLPPFPDRHTYMQTPAAMDLSKQAEAQLLKKKQKRQIEASLTRIHRAELEEMMEAATVAESPAPATAASWMLSPTTTATTPALATPASARRTDSRIFATPPARQPLFGSGEYEFGKTPDYTAMLATPTTATTSRTAPHTTGGGGGDSEDEEEYAAKDIINPYLVVKKTPHSNRKLLKKKEAIGVSNSAISDRDISKTPLAVRPIQLVSVLNEEAQRKESTKAKKPVSALVAKKKTDLSISIKRTESPAAPGGGVVIGVGPSIAGSSSSAEEEAGGSRVDQDRKKRKVASILAMPHNSSSVAVPGGTPSSGATASGSSSNNNNNGI